MQKVERPTNRSYYVNLPVVLAEAMALAKGEELAWIMEDKNTLMLVRKNGSAGQVEGINAVVDGS